MTNFNDWSQDNLANFASEANTKIVALKTEINKLLISEINKAYFNGYKEGFANARDELSKNCPKCASFHVSIVHTTVTGIDTSYRCCDDCDHQWRFE
jgi:hypothetical protein